MARKITIEAIEAFMSGKKFNKDNTTVIINHITDCILLQLHGNLIARRYGNKVEITNAGWQSNTTKECLNGIPGVNIYQRKGVWYLNGVEWDGKWITVN